jgi:hypothetical protein
VTRNTVKLRNSDNVGTSREHCGSNYFANNIFLSALSEDKEKGLSRQVSRNRKVEAQKLSDTKQTQVANVRQSRNTKRATK